MLTRLWSRHWPLLTLALVAALCGAAAPFARDVERDGSPRRMFIRGDADAQLWHDIEDEFGNDDILVVIFRSPDTILTPERLSAISAYGDAVERLDNVRQVIHLANVETARDTGELIEVAEVFEPIPEGEALRERAAYATAHPLLSRRVLSEDGRSGAMIVRVDDPRNPAVTPLVHRMREMVADMIPPELEVLVTGTTAVGADYNDLIGSSLALLLPVTVALIAVLLYWAFHSVSAVFTPLLAAGVGIWWMYAVMERVDLVVTILGSIVPIVVLIVTIACCIHLLNAYGEAIGRGESKRAAARSMLRTTGVASALAAATTAAGFGSLGFAGINLVREYGLMSAIGVVTSFASTIVLVPALCVLSRRAPRPPRPHGRIERALERTAHVALTRPSRVLAASLALILVAVLLAFRVENNNFMLGEVDPGHPVERAGRVLEEELAGLGRFKLSVRGENGAVLEPESLRAIAEVQDWLSRHPQVRLSRSFVDYIADMHHVFGGAPRGELPDSRALVEQYLLLLDQGDDNGELPRLLSYDRSWALVEIFMPDIGSRQQLGLQRDIREHLAAHPAPPGVEMRLGGLLVIQSKSSLQIVVDLVVSFTLAFATVLLVMILALRSVGLATLAVAPNLVPALGMLAYMGGFGVLLRTTTAVCFAVALGIAVDDTIHFLLRFQRELRRSGSVRAAVETTVSSVGRALVLTSIVLIAGFLIIGFSPFSGVSQLGYLTAIALVTGLVANLVLLPALLVTFPRLAGAAARAPQAAAGHEHSVNA